jgi:hypothetical protein
LSRWIAACGRWLNLSRFFLPMTLLSNWSIWQCGIYRKSGRCRLEIGNLPSIDLRSSSRIVSTSSF